MAARGIEDLQNILPVQILVLSNLGLRVILFLCAGARRRETSTGVPVRLIFLWLAYNFGDIVATYTLTRLSYFSTEGTHPLVALWAPFLLLYLAGPDNIAGYSLQDNQLYLRSLQTFFSQVIAGGYFLYKYRDSRGHFLLLASGLMYIVGVVKYGERWLALQRGNLGSIRDSIMKKKQAPAMNNSHDHRQDVKLMEIDGHNKTVLDEESSVRRAHSLFYICKSGMVYYSDDVARSYSFMGKMDHVEWWTIVEIELSLMYDILYTKAAVIHTWHGYTIRVISPLVILTSLLLFHFSDEHGHSREVDTATTYLLFVSALFMELTSLLNTVSSSWMFAYLSTTRIPWLRYTFLCSGRWHRLRRLVVSLQSIATCGISSRSGARRWSGNMGQYNMLHFCTRPNTLLTRPLLGWLADLLGLGELWNRKHFSGAIKMSDYKLIQKRIEDHVHDRLYMEGGLNKLGLISDSWGIRTLVRHNLDYYELKETLGVEFQEAIIIWHIGTDFFLSMCNSGNASVGLVKAIKALSNYMMFLLVERPSMLPGIAQNKLYERTCNALYPVVIHYNPTGICAKLKSLFGWRDQPGRYTSMAPRSRTGAENLYNKYVVNENYTYETVRLDYSALVARELLKYEAKHCSTAKSLELLLDMWTDMLVYAANRSSRRDLDAKKLSSGGELTTIVWLLVEHFHQAALEYDSKQASTNNL